jgi:hypothetical protein
MAQLVKALPGVASRDYVHQAAKALPGVASRDYVHQAAKALPGVASRDYVHQAAKALTGLANKFVKSENYTKRGIIIFKYRIYTKLENLFSYLKD